MTLLVAVATAPAEPGGPEITGNTWVGETLTSSSAGDTGVYRWQRCDPSVAACADTDKTDPEWDDIQDATSASLTYVLTSADLGQMIRVLAKGTSLGEHFVSSAPVGPVTLAPGAPVNLTAPTISGDAAEGKSVTVNPGEWAGTPPIFTYSWERCEQASCEPIAGADEQRYNPTADDVGHALRVLVTASNEYGEASEYSQRTAEVSVLPPELRESAVIDPSCPLPVAEPGENYHDVDRLTNVPVGTKIDVSECVGELITVRNVSGKTQSVAVAGSGFKFGQRAQGRPIVVLKLVGEFTKKPTAALGAPSGLAHAAGAAFKRCKKIFGKKKCRKLVAKGDCLCSTSGVFASGTVRGSTWYVQDGPGYTFAKAIVHKLLVRDKLRKKKVLLKPGQHYIARNGRPLGACSAWSPGVC